jgi:hypothetical protein
MISLLNLNTCPQFESVAADDFIGLVLLPPAESWIEEEMRRNVFWLAYAMDRTTSLGSAFGIDNNDLGQYFPVRGDLFDNGVMFYLIIPSSRLTFYSCVSGPGVRGQPSVGTYRKCSSRSPRRSMRLIHHFHQRNDADYAREEF